MSLYYVYKNYAGEFFEWLHKNGGHEIVAIDIEGDNLESPHQNRVRTVQFGDENVGWNLPLVDLDNQSLLDNNYDLVREALEVLEGTRKVLHNCAYDIPQMVYHLDLDGWDWEHTDDTMLASQIHWPEHSAALKYLNDKYIQAGSSAGSKKLKKFMEKGYACPDHVKTGRCGICRGRRRVPYTWADVPVDAYVYWAYGALDTVLTARLWRYMQDRDMFSHKAVVDKHKLTEMTVEMSRRGLKIDRAYCEQQLEAAERDTGTILNNLKEAYGITSLNSSPQLAKVINSLGGELTQRTKTGAIKVDKKVLQNIEGSDELLEFVKQVLWYKKRKKDKEYFEGFLKYIDDNNFLHTQMNPNIARTGRMSSSKPNLQNLTASNSIVRNAVIVG